ncbi:Wzz/FepE/Etk N-terminal domain-containing protein [uncultured Acetobacteroides sp.]|uniref:Wzz/FepE/Etk N-terminal domain-containing protein n=1 Tax=uncultured Acetobacteroides sp. TaxID=1760811 RepID=UPI0029F468A2|nr:Wzz/FepE/Etk N-terminal domain-containing protein [uncultured Acetobacteroides sp.]
MTNTPNNQQPQIETSPTKKSGEIEIDLLELARNLWDNRKFILKVTSIFAAIGLFVAIFSAKEYTSSVTMVPQLGDGKSKAGGLAGLAAMAGVNLGDMGGGDVLSPTIYPKIMASVPFQKDLMYTKVKFDNIPHEITLYDYYTNEDYQPFNLFVSIKKYTIGLPVVIIKAVKGEISEKGVGNRVSKYLRLSQKEDAIAKLLSSKVSLAINEKEGTLNLTANMPEALASTQVVEAARLLLQKYITDFKVDKVKQNLDFIQQRYNEAKASFEQKQMQLAAFKDGNRNVILASAQTTGDRINAEYTLLYSVYSELAKQLEQAKIKVKDATPVLTVVEPAVVPNIKSKPNRPMILVVYSFLGFFFGVVGVFIISFLYKVNGGKFEKLMRKTLKH